MSSTVTQIVNSFIDDTRIGLHGTGTFAAGTLTDTTELQNTNYQGNEFKGKWLGYLDSTTASDRAKPLGSNSLAPATGVLTHAGSNISGTGASKNYTITARDWHPVRDLIPLVNRSLQMCYQWERAPLTLVPNGDGEDAAVGGSNSSASTTANTTAAYVRNGKQSLRVANSGANGYHQYATMDAAAGQPFTVGVWVRIAVGTATVALVDVSNSSATIVSTTVTGVGEWFYVQLSGSFPATCYQTALRVGGSEASADTYWDDACLYWQPVTVVNGPSWVTQYRDEDGLPAFRLLQMVSRTAGTNSSGAGLAYNLRVVPHNEYQVLNLAGAANAVQFELSSQLTASGYPIFIEARRPFSDAGVVDDGADSTNCPLRLVVAAMKRIAANDRTSPNRDKQYGGNDSRRMEWLVEQKRATSMLQIPTVGQARGLTWRRS